MALSGCVAPKTKSSAPTAAELQAKAGVTAAEWDEMLKPITEEKAAPLVPTTVEYLKPGVLVIFVSEIHDDSSWPVAELRFHRKQGKWELQTNILREEDRKRGRFVSIAEFERMLIENEEQVRRKIEGSVKEFVLNFSFENYVSSEVHADPSKGYWHSRLPSVRGWQYIVDQLDYRQDVFVINSAQETVVAMEFEGEFRYVIAGAFDFTHVFIPPGLKRPTQILPP